jgi:hypothetical protein
MTSIPKEQVMKRWDSLPLVFREALCSEINSDFIWKTCEAEYIPNEKIYTVSRVAGIVLMGFLHPEDMAAEIRDEIGVDIRIATSIANSINQRIFAPIRADIDKIYNPITPTGAAPKIIEEIRPAGRTSASAPAPLPPVSSAAPLSAAVPPTPKTGSVKPILEKTAASSDEFSRLEKKSAPASIPKPVVLQTESVSRPIPNAPNFKLPTIAEDIMADKKNPEPLPIRSAIVEFGGTSIPSPRKTIPVPQPSATPKITVVRYGNEKSKPPILPPVPEPARTITEITPETLKTVTPMPKAPSFTPISQIPIPSVAASKPPVPVTPISSSPFSAPKPLAAPAPQIPQPINTSEKTTQKDYSEKGK